MGIPVIVLGESGSGKSTSIRNLNPETTLVIQAVQKPLPFRAKGWLPFDDKTAKGSVLVCDNSDKICAIVSNAHKIGKQVIIIDDMQYMMANEFMRRSQEKGFEKFTEIGKHAWEVINAASASQLRVYFLWHTETDDLGKTQAKTIGKLLSEKICIEGMFSIVLRCLVSDGQHYFATVNSGSDTVKAPHGMFASASIPNDLAIVDKAITDYYSEE